MEPSDAGNLAYQYLRLQHIPYSISARKLIIKLSLSTLHMTNGYLALVKFVHVSGFMYVQY